ncbi:MAG: prolyl oligopeptidase family serine peptidase, partial [Bacteroidetes bacterium]|nr:prolyl oligopeptidase family serine peptidase [Bacteroidota bacterium]
MVLHTMKNIILAAFLLLLTACQSMDTKPEPPIAKKLPKELLIHGDTRIDNYYWLNERDNPEVIEYLKAENAYTDDVMSDTKALQDSLFNEIVGRIKKEDISVPYKDNHYFYYIRYNENSEYPIYCRKKESMDAVEEIILDVNDEAKDHEYFQVSGITISPDNKIAAYGVDTISRRIYTIHFKNLETGETLSQKIQNTTGKATWANDNNTVFYTRKNTKTLRYERVMKHYLDAPETLHEVYYEADETFYTGVTKSRSKKYIIIFSESTTTTEFRYLNANEPDGEFQLFHPRETDHEYSISHINNKFIIRTNMDNATNFKLMETPEDKTGKENWKEVIPHRKDVFIESFQNFQHYLVLEERKNGQSHLRIIHTAQQKEHYVPFEEEAYTVWISINPEINTDLLRFNYTSLTTPISTFDYNMKTGEKTLLKQQEVLGGFHVSDYQSERHYVTARDGAKIPVSLVYKKGIKLDGDNPLLLYGYGSYGHTVDPYFSSVRLSLLNRGIVFVIAHIRGGQMMGRQWYEEGKMLNKKNTFHDFIDCAEY